MKTIVAGIAAGLSILALLLAVAQAQTDPPANAPADRASDSNKLEAAQSGRNVFRLYGSGSVTAEKMAERFKDPQQRAAATEQLRQSLLESHQDIGEVLQLDAATKDELIELLADQQLADQERSFTNAVSQRDPWRSCELARNRRPRKFRPCASCWGRKSWSVTRHSPLA